MNGNIPEDDWLGRVEGLSDDNTDLDDIGYTDKEGVNTIQPGINDEKNEYGEAETGSTPEPKTVTSPSKQTDAAGNKTNKEFADEPLGIIDLLSKEPESEEEPATGHIEDEESQPESGLALSDNELLSLFNTDTYSLHIRSFQVSQNIQTSMWNRCCPEQ